MSDIIPPATAEKLATNFPKGTRHKAAMDIALPMIGNGIPGEAVYTTLRSKFPTDVSDIELRNVVSWAESKHPTPTAPGFNNVNGNGTGNGTGNGYARNAQNVKTSSAPKKTPMEMVDWWTSGARVTVEKMAAQSPAQIPDSLKESSKLALASLYSDTDHLNIVCKYTLRDGKANPQGGGKILLRDAWLEWFDREGPPHSDAGAWFRINPCNATGSGKDGAPTDADVTSFRFLLVESDTLPIPSQLAFYARLKLPVAAVVLSAGGSAHAWIKLDAIDLETYKATTSKILAALKPFGFDPSNSNASRLSRLPGAERKIGASDDGLQRLIWLNPNATPLNEDGFKAFNESLEFPAIEERPLLAIAQAAINRYEAMRLNAGKLGVPTGIPQLDAVCGGWKPGHTIVISATTGGGKSTMALHMVDAALTAGYGVALFSLEMDKEEVFDLIMANRCSVDRNKFNTGYFSDHDIGFMAKGLPAITNLPLYIEDSALSSADQIRVRVMQLKSAGKIGLVVVDYIQFVNPGLTRENREQQIAGISHSLRALARETKIPFLILSQLNDDGKLRESRVIAHNANIVMNVEIKKDEVSVKIVKGRGIPQGEYKLQFLRRLARLLPDKPEPARDPYAD